ncbi:MAG: dipeptide transport system permease protein [Polaribacter sp.]|jgi:dipeptide transport system permease protein
MFRIFIRQILNLTSSFFLLCFFTFILCDYFFPEGLSFIIPIDSFNSSETGFLSQIILYFSRFFEYLSNVLTGRLGYSISRGISITDEIIHYLPASMELAFVTLALSLTFGLWLGTIAAKCKDKWQDKLILSVTLIGYSLPIFWWAMLLVLFFSMWLGITPVASRIGFEYDIDVVTGFLLFDSLLSPRYGFDAFISVIHHMILPVIVLGTIPLAAITRVTRSSMIKTLSEDYINNAIVRGIPTLSITWKHALRNAFEPILTSLSLQISSIITGAIITESIFAWPGAGKWLLEAVYRRDFPVIHGGLLITAGIVIFIYITLDYISMWLNPKLRDRSS